MSLHDESIAYAEGEILRCEAKAIGIINLDPEWYKLNQRIQNEKADYYRYFIKCVKENQMFPYDIEGMRKG
jgi:hypothetical protein